MKYLSTPWPSHLALLGLALLALPAAAQFKVVGPDGSVTYTDRPRAEANSRITPLGRNGAPAAADAALPLELRQPVLRYPVTLYTAPDCAPCENARRYLQQRGIPFGERRVTSDEDASALERVVGSRSIPALGVGAQALRGFSEIDWSAYLDAAGYPRESRLPRNWQNPSPVAMVEKAAPARPAPAQVPEPRPIEDPLPTSGPRF